MDPSLKKPKQNSNGIFQCSDECKEWHIEDPITPVHLYLAKYWGIMDTQCLKAHRTQSRNRFKKMVKREQAVMEL